MTKRKRGRGTIEQRSSGSLRVSVYAGIDPITKRRYYLRETVPADHPAKDAEARRALDRLCAQVAEKRHPRTRATVAQLMERYLERIDVEPTTWSRYEECIRLHIRPLLGAVPLAKIDGEILDSFFTELRRCRVHCDRRKKTRDHKIEAGHDNDDRGQSHVCKGLDNWTLRKIYWILSSAFDRAHRTWRWVGHNPMKEIKPPAGRPANPSPPTVEQAAKILDRAWTDPQWGMLVWLTMITGMRRGELCGLRWSHIDFGTGVIRLSTAIAFDRRGRTVYEKDTKTHQRRHIVLDASTVALLKTYRDSCETIAAALGVNIDEEAFVFSPEPGHTCPWKPGLVTSRYNRMVRRLGIRTSLHKLRHYSATELIAAGVDVRTIAGRLGHSGGGATTLRFYSAFVSEADQRAAPALASRLPQPPVEIDSGLLPHAKTYRETTSEPAPYERIAADLQAAITCGALQPDDPLPAVKELADRYSVGVGTAHRAIAKLTEAGIVKVSRGRRARVAGQRTVADEQV